MSECFHMIKLLKKRRGQKTEKKLSASLLLELRKVHPSTVVSGRVCASHHTTVEKFCAHL